MNGTNTTGNAFMSSSLCRSKCRIDDIPDVARNLTWKDQFYEIHDNGAVDIIAAFDIDRTVFGRTAYEILKWFILAPSFSILFFPLYYVFPPLIVILVFYYVIILCVYLLRVVANCNRNEKRVRINRMHIAISTHGIYIDEAASSSSNNMMCRTIISFGEIQKCKVLSEYNGFYGTTYYNVTITNEYYKYLNEKDK